MKKVIAIMLMLLCVFSLSSAEWGRIRYLDEFGNVDATQSNPYQIVSAARLQKGSFDYGCSVRFLTNIPPDIGTYCAFTLTIFDESFNIVPFEGDTVTIQAKGEDDRIIEIVWTANGENLFVFGNEVVDIMNQLYRGQSLKFVLYYKDSRYYFTVNAEGYKEVADEFIVADYVPETPIIMDTDDMAAMTGVTLPYKMTSTYFEQKDEGFDSVLCIGSGGFLTFFKYPSLSLTLYYKSENEPFWYHDGEYLYQNVHISTENEMQSFLLNGGIQNDGRNYHLQDESISEKAIAFVKKHDNVRFQVTFLPHLEFDIPMSSDQMLSLLTF